MDQNLYTCNDYLKRTKHKHTNYVNSNYILITCPYLPLCPDKH